MKTIKEFDKIENYDRDVMLLMIGMADDGDWMDEASLQALADHNVEYDGENFIGRYGDIRSFLLWSLNGNDKDLIKYYGDDFIIMV